MLSTCSSAAAGDASDDRHAAHGAGGPAEPSGPSLARHDRRRVVGRRLLRTPAGRHELGCAILPKMSSLRGSRLVAFRPITLLLAGLIAVPTIAGPARAACCAVRDNCCPQGIARQDHDRPALSAPVPPCCRQLSTTDGTPQGDRPARTPSAPVIAVLPTRPNPAVETLTTILVSAPPPQAPISPPSRPRPARAPPLA
jgi:hypothetical protein